MPQAVYGLFEARSRLLDISETARRHWARNMSGALIGFAGAFGAFGGVAINLALRQSYASTGEETATFWISLAFYIVASILTWVMYVRWPVSAPVAAGSETKSASARA